MIIPKSEIRKHIDNINTLRNALVNTYGYEQAKVIFFSCGSLIAGCTMLGLSEEDAIERVLSFMITSALAGNVRTGWHKYLPELYGADEDDEPKDAEPGSTVDKPV